MPPKVVLITGCSGTGIGYNLGCAFYQAGCRVFVSARDPKKLSASNFPADVEQVQMDVTDAQSVAAAVKLVEEKAGHIDVLVNNAGQGCVGALCEVDQQKARQTFETNVMGLLTVTQAVSKKMIERRSGLIVNISSIVSFVPTPWAGIYCATKAAVTSLSDVLRMELGGFNVNVLCVFPGAIQSNIGAANASSIAVPANSPYQNVSEQIKARGSWSQCPQSTKASQLASQIVKASLQKHPPSYLSAGYRSTRAWWSYYLPHWAKDYLWGSQFGIAEVGRV